MRLLFEFRVLPLGDAALIHGISCVLFSTLKLLHTSTLEAVARLPPILTRSSRARLN